MNIVPTSIIAKYVYKSCVEGIINECHILRHLAGIIYKCCILHYLESIINECHILCHLKGIIYKCCILSHLEDIINESLICIVWNVFEPLDFRIKTKTKIHLYLPVCAFIAIMARISCWGIITELPDVWPVTTKA